MSVRKICVVVTARPSYSRIKTALRAIQLHPELELQLVISGSALLERYGNVASEAEKDGFQISERIFNIVEGSSLSSMAKTTGLAIMELSTVFNNLKPDIVVSIADRFETLATSIAASYQNITLAHIQGGEVTGSIDEKVRHANTKLADIHLVSSDDARKRVLRLGESADMIFNTGCPSIDIAKEVNNNPKLSYDPISKYGGVGDNIDHSRGYIVVLQHPVTNEIQSTNYQILQTLQAINEIGIPAFMFWPNVDAGSDDISKEIRRFRENKFANNIHFFKNMSPNDFLLLIKNSLCLVGNSSVGIREASFLGVPVVNIGSRQNKRLRGKNVLDCNYDKKEIGRSISNRIKNGHFNQEFIYGEGNAGQKIAEVLATCKLRFHKTITY